MKEIEFAERPKVEEDVDKVRSRILDNLIQRHRKMGHGLLDCGFLKDRLIIDGC